MMIYANDSATAVRYLKVVSTTVYRVVLAVYRTVTVDGRLTDTQGPVLHVDPVLLHRGTIQR